jgi:isopentenyldiphosphate isomerase
MSSHNEAAENLAAEAVDADNRPLLVLPLAEVHRQFLNHRSVAVLVYDQDNRLLLQKRGPRRTLYPGRWDLSTYGHVLARESSYDAALRRLWADLRLRPERLRHVRDIPAGPETGREFVSVFAVPRAGHLEPNAERVSDGFFHTREELACLVRDFRELLTPSLVLFWERNLPFSPWELR